jgi:hypothetical protein
MREVIPLNFSLPRLFTFLLSFSAPSLCINPSPIPLTAFVGAIPHPLNSLRMPPKRAPRRIVTLPVRYTNQPSPPSELAGPVQARKRRRTAPEQPEETEETENPVLAALARIEHRMDAIEARNEQFETRCDDLEVSQQDQLVQLTESIDEIKQLVVNNRRLSSSMPRHLSSPMPPATSSSTPLVAHGNNPPAANLRSRWSWVDSTLIQSIANGDFDIHSLPKLHSEESLRKKFTTSAIEGFFIPANNTKAPELRDGTPKLYASFNDINTFLSAWYVYIMIRGAYHPERFGCLIHWTEQINQFHRTGYPWDTILSYITRYFQCHQNAPPETWYLIDQELMASQLVMGMVRHYRGNPTSTKVDKRSHVSNERCNNYNDERKGCTIEQKFNRPCVRRHACHNCDKLGHPSYKCPDASNPPKASVLNKTRNPSS